MCIELEPTSYRRAREIMGRGFFGIKDAMRCFGVSPTSQELSILDGIPFPEETLERFKDSHILMALFNLSILNIRKIKADLFSKQSWYDDERFARITEGKAGWQLIRKATMPTVSGNDDVRSAQIAVYAFIAYYLKTGERLFESCVRTESIAFKCSTWERRKGHEGEYIPSCREPFGGSSRLCSRCSVSDGRHVCIDFKNFIEIYNCSDRRKINFLSARRKWR